MSFGIANNVKSKVRVCTPELFHRALESRVVAEVCAQIKDALEAVRRGEMSPEDFETLKSDLKKALIIFTFHATFKEGRRKNEEAIPSGLSIYDLDHIPNPEGRWAEIEPRKEELGIVLAHITPSTEGLRLVFMRPLLTGRPPLTPPEGGESQDGMMSLAEAQAWMARQLGDDKYDACVKDYARCSFAVPREYVLYQSEALFNEELRMKNFLPRVHRRTKKKILHYVAKRRFFILHSRRPSKALPTTPSSGNGSAGMGANPSRANATPSSTSWPRTCATSRTTTRRTCYKSCPAMD